jgi:Pentapeptide repeats (8 copies)
MAANNKSLLPPANNQIWVPAVSQKNQKDQKAIARRHKDKSIAVEANNTLWLPHSSPKEQTLVIPPHANQPRKRLNISKLLRPIINIPHALGFKDKKLWDWLPLLLLFLLLLAILAISGAIYQGFSGFATQQMQQQDRLAQQTFQEQVHLAQQQSLEQESLATQTAKQQQLLLQQVGSIADQGHEQILTAYLNSMSDLLPALKKSKDSSSTRLVAQTKTLAIVNALKADPIRLAIVLQFLHDSGLIAVSSRNSQGPIISLNNVTLNNVNLQQANLSSTNFDGAILTNINLSQATLTSSSFRGATLTKAVFTNAILDRTDFSGANLENANLTGATLKGTNLNGADTKNANLKGIIW